MSVDEGDLDDDKITSAGIRKPAWLRALAAAAKLDGGVSKLRTPRKRPKVETPCKITQGGEAQFPFCLDCEKAYAAQSAKAKTPTIAAKHDNPDNWADQWPYGGHGKARAPKVPAKGGHGIKIASVDEDDSDDDKISSMGATKPALL